ncbi:XRE family transcriptional regulator, partial [Paenibacillus sp. TAF58]
ANYSGDGETYPIAKEIDQGLQNIINQLSYPAIIANNRTEVLAYNQLASEIITDFQAIPAEKRVMTRLIFTDPNLRKQLANWKEFADYTLGVFRMYFDQKAGDLWYEEFVRRMCKESEEFLSLWRLHDVHLKKSIQYTFDHFVAGRLYFQLNTFSNINGDENLHCCVFTPIAGTDTEQKLVHICK